VVELIELMHRFKVLRGSGVLYIQCVLKLRFGNSLLIIVKVGLFGLHILKVMI
jgi:hypothetical protein